MRYIINKTSGEKLAEIVDTTVDQTSTSLTLIGNNYAGYGEYLNENFVKLLENEANLSAPDKPLVGQLWYDSKNNRLKVYTGLSFRETGGPLVQGNAPVKQTKGDLWIDSVENQLYFYDGSDRQLAGPIYKNSQKLSGFTTDTILDTKNISRTIVRCWVGQDLIGIFSKETAEFTPKVVIPGFTGKIYPGFNQGNINGLKFNVVFDNAMALTDPLGVQRSAESFMRTNTNTGSSGTLTIQNSVPLILGNSQEVSILSDASNLQIINSTSGLNQVISLRNSSGVFDAITVDALNEKIGLFNSTPTEKLSVVGNIIVDSDLAAGRIQTGIMLSDTVDLTTNELDLSLGNYFSKILTDNTALTLKNIPQQSGIAIEITLDIYNSGNYSITWWNNIHWANDFAPTLSANGHDIFKFFTTDNGLNWIGYLEIENLE